MYSVKTKQQPKEGTKNQWVGKWITGGTKTEPPAKMHD